MINRIITFAIVVWPVQLLAGDIDQIRKLLDKMQHAAHMVSYDGTFVYSQNSQLSAMRIIHSADSKGERERLVSLDTSGREVIRDAKSVTCFLPDSKAVVVEKKRPPVQFPPPFPKNIEHLTAQYTFTLKGEERVAGQLAQKLDVQPKDHFRYGHQLWIDKKTGLLLKTHLLNEKGKPVEQFMFTHITYLKHVPEKLLKPGVDSRDLIWYEAAGDVNLNIKNSTPKLAWQVKKIPSGFKRDHTRKHTMPRTNKPLEHLVYSDGLASISVFIEDKKDNDNLIGGTRMGAVNAHGRSINGYHITAVGEVPHATVKMISESIEYKDK
ncbi:MAG: MucB/RseB C-terminal domain-containing protein [Gammaproteobacteria bacterium]|nr:MucB/RseB C-terminal domain-containing protein [Gammaproteobacteria bacterium]